MHSAQPSPTTPEREALDDEFFAALDRGITRLASVADQLDDVGHGTLNGLRMQASCLRTITGRPRLRLVAVGGRS